MARSPPSDSFVALPIVGRHDESKINRHLATHGAQIDRTVDLHGEVGHRHRFDCVGRPRTVMSASPA